MTKRFYLLGSMLLWSAAMFAQAKETMLLRQPDISKSHITFVYAGDVWLAEKDGSNPKKITSNPAEELYPKFSPDGKTIAFTGNYDGNTDIYTVGLHGGNPERITYHPAADMLRGWLDLETVYFTSTRDFEYSPGGTRLHKKGLENTHSEALTMPEAYQGSPSPDGKKWAYIKNGDPSERQRVAFKRYRGGGMPAIWIFDEKTHEIEIIPSANSNNVQPLWRGDFVYFLSDRNKIMNLFRYNTISKEVEQVSFFEDFDIKTFAGNDTELILEQGGKLHLYSIESKQIQPIKIHLDSDVIDTRAHYVDMDKNIRDYAISPTGVRALFQSRGEIFSVPLDKGSTRNISNTPGAHDKYPAWSPNGKWISYISDKNETYQLVLSDQKGAEDPVYIDIGDTHFYFEPTWSPDSKKLFFGDSHLNLFYVDIDTKKVIKVDTDSMSTNTGRVYNQFQPSWSTDSNWIAYVKTLANQVPAIFMYNVKTGDSKQITDGMSHVQSPKFSADGKYLFFTASTNIGLSYHGLHMTAYGSSPTRSVYAFILSEETPSPLQPESDEEKIEADEKEDKKKDKKEEKEKEKEEKEKSIRIDLNSSIQNRIIALPIPSGQFRQINGAVEGKLLYTQHGKLHAFDFEKLETEELADKIFSFKISADGKKIMYPSQGNYYIANAGSKIKNAPDNMVKTNGIKQLVDPVAEWKQVFDEVWHMQKEYFYAENMHGLDWEATRKQYEPFLEFVKHRADLTYLLNEMMGEMVVGHNYIYPGTQPQAPSVSVGMLGADYQIHKDHYRIEKIYSTYDWNPKLKSPLTMPGLGIKEGDYILEVNGRKLNKETNIYSLFDFTVNKQVSLTVNDKPNLNGAKEVIVLPISYGQEVSLRKTDWMEENRKRTDELSDHKIAYIYMPNTAGEGYENFNRFYFSQMDKKAVLIDERNNGGGKVADYVIDLLSRDVISFWGIRDGKSFNTPGNGIYGPKAMIINENAGSGGDMMPYMFRHKGLGKLVGRTTMGILVGISGYPPLLDGGSITSPNFGVYDLDGNWIIENEGVAPDVFVEQTPKDLLAGRDPQLEKTIEILLEEMKTYPYKEVPKPADPLRAE